MSEWERCKDYLRPALDDTWSLEAVRDEIEAGRAKLWPLTNSAAVTQLHRYPAGRVLRVWLAGGDLDELRREFWRLDEYAEQQDCIRIEIEGRPGWERALEGFTKTRVILAKEV